MGEKIYSFFWWLAGANSDILKEHIIDHNKYFQMGVAVFITAVMATFTGGFAIHYAINKGFDGEISIVTIIGALFWGFVILSLDRFLVISINKKGNALIQPTWQKKFYFFLKELTYAFPRVFLAILIAQVVLVPMELYFFKNQIENIIPVIVEKEQKKFLKLKQEEENKLTAKFHKNKQVIKEKYQSLLEPLKKERESLKEKINQLQNAPTSPKLLKLLETQKEIEKKVNFYRQLRDDELKTGKGQGYQFANKNLAQARRELEQVNQELKAEMRHLKQISSENIKKVAKLKEKLKKIEHQITMLEETQSQELNNLFQKYTNELETLDKERANYRHNYQKGDLILALKAKDILFDTDPKYYTIHKLLTLLLITIELLPLIVKIFLPRTSYDAHIQRLSEEMAMKHDVQIRDQKLKYYMQFKKLKLKENVEYEKLEKNLRKIKFTLNEN